jgi:hypothetical protein
MASSWIDMPYHQQDKSYYCGAAVAQMMIEDGTSEPDDQETLYNPLHDPGQNWYTAPDRLATFLGQRLHDTFAVSSEPDPFTACERLASALVLARVAVPAVVLDGQHWVLVTGVTYRAAERTGEIETVDGFYFNDPSPVTAYVIYPGALSPPLPHGFDDHCGRGDHYGFANTYATIGGWLSEYWPPSQSTPCITVLQTLPTLPRPLRLGARRACDQVTPGPAPISSDRATACATAGIVRNAIDREGPLARQLHGFDAAAARYVAGDDTTAAYFLVFLKRAGKFVGTATVDALDGALGSVQAATTAPRPPNTEHAHIVNALRAEASRGTGFRHFRYVADDEVVVDEALYWGPSRESISRHRPFVRIHVAGTTLYRGLDGRFHSALEPAGA